MRFLPKRDARGSRLRRGEIGNNLDTFDLAEPGTSVTGQSGFIAGSVNDGLLPVGQGAASPIRKMCQASTRPMGKNGPARTRPLPTVCPARLRYPDYCLPFFATIRLLISRVVRWQFGYP